MSTADDSRHGETASRPEVGPDRIEHPQSADSVRSVKVPFESVNILVVQDPTPEYIQLLVLVPLADGSASETRVTLGTPTKSFRPDGRVEYKLVIDSNFTVTPIEKESTGRVKLETRDGLKWALPAGYPAALTGLLAHEPIVTDFLTSQFAQGKVFVDVGANVGAYSLRAAARGMEVQSFEPNPENIKVLKRNAELNHLTIVLQEYALGAFPGTVKLTLSGSTSMITEGDGVEVPMRTLDSFDIPRVDLLKVDVEGYELEVLRGAELTLERSHPTMMIEMHHWVGVEKEAALFEILTRLGYNFEYLDRYPQGRHLAATHKN